MESNNNKWEFLEDENISDGIVLDVVLDYIEKKGLYNDFKSYYTENAN